MDCHTGMMKLCQKRLAGLLGRELPQLASQEDSRLKSVCPLPYGDFHAQNWDLGCAWVYGIPNFRDDAPAFPDGLASKRLVLSGQTTTIFQWHRGVESPKCNI